MVLPDNPDKPDGPGTAHAWHATSNPTAWAALHPPGDLVADPDTLRAPKDGDRRCFPCLIALGTHRANLLDEVRADMRADMQQPAQWTPVELPEPDD